MTDESRPLARVVADADLCIPTALADRAGIVVTPPGEPLLLERTNIPRLIVEAGGNLDSTAVVDACLTAAQEAGAVVYVPTGDGHARPESLEDDARRAVEAAGHRFLTVAVDDTLMAAGWRAVIAAEALADGATPEAAAERARAAATHLLALVEHPELAGHSQPGNLGVASRVVAWLRGHDVELDSAPNRREDALRRLRDHFAESVEGAQGLRVAVLHGGVAPAAEAMATWIARHVDPVEVHVAAITRHAATRVGPGFVGIAWTAERD